MKFSLALLTLFLLLSCGILELLFPIEYPQRYIEREVNQAELVGTWEITPDSERRVTDYVQKNVVTLGALESPWKSISLFEDGTCEIELVYLWVYKDGVLRYPDAPATCTWRLDSILGYGEDGADIHVPGLLVRFEHYNKGADMYYVYFSESYIVKENNELILWNFIDINHMFSYQDFKKANND